MPDLIDFQNHWSKLVDRYFESGIESLTESEQIWLSAQSLIQAIFDGGLISYYYNSGADDMDYCLTALEYLGQFRLSELIHKVNDELFDGDVPRNIERRNEIIGSWPDDGVIDAFLDPIEDEALTLAYVLEERLVRFIRETNLAP